MSDETLSIEARTHGRVLVRRPAGAGRGTLAGFHGYAEGARAQLDRLAGIPGSARWTLVAPQALNRFYRGRTDETVACWMTREDRLTSIADNLEYVRRALDAADAGVGRLVLAGFSQGVAMAFRAAVRGTRPAAAVIAVGGDIPPELLEGAASFPPVLLIRGADDEWYTAEKMAADAAALRARQTPVQAEVVSGRHEWNRAVSDLAGAFLGRL